MSDSVCRICLVSNVRMCYIENNQILETFRNVTSAELITAERPRGLCYICHSLLRGCYRFSEMARRSEQILSTIIRVGYEVSPNSIAALDVNVKHIIDLSTAHMQSMTFNDLATPHTCDVAVKDELLQVKLETSEDEQITTEESTAYPEIDTIANELIEPTVTKMNTNLEHYNKNDRSPSNNKSIQKWNILKNNHTEKKRCTCEQCDESFSSRFNDLAMPHTCDVTVKDEPIKVKLETSAVEEIITEESTASPEIDTIANDLIVPTVTRMNTDLEHCNKNDRRPANNKSIQKWNILNNILTEKKLYTCEKCDKSFSSRFNDLAIPHTCDVTVKDEPFQVKLETLAYEEIITEERTASQEIDTIANDLFEQTVTRINSDLKHCSKNDSTTSNNKSVQKRSILKSTHTENTQYVCEQCDKSFRFKCKLITHMRVHTGEKPYACKLCDKRFKASSSIITHMRIHTGEKPFACKHCDKRFTVSSALFTHMRNITGEKLHACKHCDKKFSASSGLINHMLLHTGEKSYTCEHCEKCFFQKGNLLTHMRIHTGEYPYECNHCDKRFHQKQNLKTHMRVHEKPYACKHCDKKFSDSGSLVIHMRTHTREKRYACQYCDKKFSQISNLRSHTRIHTGEKPYACKHCEKRFVQSTGLISHMRIHTGEYPYTCKHCEKSFRQCSGLIAHMRTHTGEYPYACMHCDKRFNQNHRLKTHMRVHEKQAL